MILFLLLAEKKLAPASPPKFTTTFDEYIRLQEGDTLELECKVTGNPLPEVTWSIGDKKVENSTITFEVSGLLWNLKI